MVTYYIRELRERKGLSQEQLARKSGVSASHIGYIENGERQATIDVLCRIALALNVDIKDLFKFVP